MNRKRLLLALALGIALVLLCVSAALADDPMKVSMELSTNKFTAPKTIKVSITVTNVGDGDMPSPVTLYYPSGKKVEEFGSPTLSDQALMPFPSMKLGPGQSSRSHSADEFILISEVEDAIKKYVELLA